MSRVFSLPYHFDTRQQGRTLLMGLWGGGVLMTVLALCLPLLNLGLGDDMTLPIQMALLLVAAADIALGYILFPRIAGAQGALAPGQIKIEADQFLGLRSSAPTGLFSPHSFSALRVMRFSGKNAGLFRKVVLVGLPPLGSLTLATLRTEEAEALAKMLSAELPLKLDVET